MNSAPRHCTVCDAVLPAHASYCVECGSNIAKVAAPVQTATSNPTCGNCGVGIPHGAAFCVNCGQPTHQSAAYPPAMVSTYNIYQPYRPAVYVTNVNTTETTPLLIRALWFISVGLWFGPLWITLAWLLNLTIVGMPLGIWMLNRTGNVMTLRRAVPTREHTASEASANLLVRSVYFVLIGWWVSLIWLMFGWMAAATIIGLPIAFLMFERTGTVMTLAEA